MHVSKLSKFIQSDVPSNTLSLIPNEFGTVFERLEELEIQYSQPEQETILHNRLLEALKFKTTHIAILFAFLYRCNPQHTVNATTTLVHRTMVHM